MRTGMLARAMAGTLAAAMLLTGLCGCNPSGDTPAPTDATTTASGAAVTTTAPETTTTVSDVTTTTATDTPTTESTKEPTPAYQIGGESVVLDGEAFTLGGSPDALFAHFGEPNRVQDDVDPESGVGDIHMYYYDNIVIKTHSLRLKSGEKVEMVRGIGFPNDHYSFDGIRVGSSVKELDQKVSSRVEVWVNWCPTKDIYGGLYYQYPPNSKSLTRWQFFLTYEEEPQRDAQGNVIVPEDSVVEAIALWHPINDFINRYRDELGDHHGSDISTY